MQTLWREPIEFTAGDTLAFSRRLADYSARDGWSLVYELRGQGQPIEFTSTADVDAHSLSVTTATTAGWLPGEYVLVGFAIKGDERYQIYYGSIVLRPNVPAESGGLPVQTFAQKMVVQIEAVMLAKAGDDLAASQVGESRFHFLTPEQLRTEHGYWSGVRRMEIAKERAKAGLPTGNKIRPILKVTSQNPSVGMFGRGTGYLGW